MRQLAPRSGLSRTFVVGEIARRDMNAGVARRKPGCAEAAQTGQRCDEARAVLPRANGALMRGRWFSSGAGVCRSARVRVSIPNRGLRLAWTAARSRGWESIEGATLARSLVARTISAAGRRPLPDGRAQRTAAETLGARRLGRRPRSSRPLSRPPAGRVRRWRLLDVKQFVCPGLGTLGAGYEHDDRGHPPGFRTPWGTASTAVVSFPNE